MFNRTSAILLTLLAWHVFLWLVASLFWGPLEMLLTRILVQPDGNPAASDAIQWMVRYSVYFTSTIGLPTLVSILLFDWLIGSRPRFSIRVGAWLIWGVAAWLFFQWTFNSDLAHLLREWDHFLFGFPESPYTSRNMVPRFVAVAMTTLPLGAIILWNYGRVSRPTSEDD